VKAFPITGEKKKPKERIVMPLPDQREAVFTRIREALRQPAPHRHADHGVGLPADAEHVAPGPDTFSAWLPAVGATLEEQINLFAENAAQLKADFRAVTSLDNASRQLTTLAAENNWKRIATHGSTIASALAESIGISCLNTDSGYVIGDLEQCDAAVTACDALVAQTGSVLVSSLSAGGRALSVLPPHHVVIAHRDQVVGDLATALQLARKRYAPHWPSFLSFISGPSRTGDIERILVLGAHGPKKLTIFLLP
jgi:L-lactate dehydrogenase complex protein LldG